MGILPSTLRGVAGQGMRRITMSCTLLPIMDHLCDKVSKLQHLSVYELGGEAADRVLADKGVSAVHTTCYEQKTKVMGLKVGGG